MIKLSDVCVFINGDRGKNYPSKADMVNVGVPFINAGHLENNTISFSNMNYITEQKYEKLSSGKICSGDLLYCLRGSLGKKAIVDEGIRGAIASSLVILRPDKSKIITEYLSYALESEKIRKQMISANNGSSQPNLSAESVKNYIIDLPDLSEQKHIVEELMRIDNLIQLCQNQISKLDELVKARFVELFGGKGYPEDTLLNLCNIIDYRGKTPEKVEYGLPFITAKNVKMHQMNLEPREYISKETYDNVMVRGFPKEGDVVFTTEAPLGNVCRIPHFDTEFYIGQRIVTMQTEKLEPIYLEYALSSDDFKMKYMGKSSGSTVTGIRVRLLEQLTIPVPPIDIQTQFAAFVEQNDKSKFEVQQSLEKLETLKKSLMQEYFG